MKKPLLTIKDAIQANSFHTIAKPQFVLGEPDLAISSAKHVVRENKLLLLLLFRIIVNLVFIELNITKNCVWTTLEVLYAFIVLYAGIVSIGLISYVPDLSLAHK